MNLFGKKKQAPSTAPTPIPVDTIKLLRDNLLVLEKREEHINKKIENALQEAKLKSGITQLFHFFLFLKTKTNLVSFICSQKR